MSKTLINFIEELDSNAKLLEESKSNPVATAKGYGLSEEDVKIIRLENDVKRKICKIHGTVAINL
jgi:hypothetical protein